MKCIGCNARCGTKCTICEQRTYCSKCEFCSNMLCKLYAVVDADEEEVKPLRTLKHLTLIK